MKRVLFALCLALSAPLLLAQDADRDILVTGDATIYTIESIAPDEELAAESSLALRLTVQRGEETTSSWLPESLLRGAHSGASLAYDASSQTLFVFWQKQPNALSSELLLASYRDGAWSEALSIENGAFHVRYNLKIGVTRYAHTTNEQAEALKVPRLVVHAVWWDETGYGENGRYAQVAIRDGIVEQIDIRNLLEWVPADQQKPAAELPADFDRNFFRHPSIFVRPDLASLDIVFGDWERNRLERIELRPRVENGVLEVPVGIWLGEIDPPAEFYREANSTLHTIAGSDTSKLIFFYRDGEKLKYVMTRDQQWSPVLSLQLTERISAEAAIEGLRKLIAFE